LHAGRRPDGGSQDALIAVRDMKNHVDHKRHDNAPSRQSSAWTTRQRTSWPARIRRIPRLCRDRAAVTINSAISPMGASAGNQGAPQIIYGRGGPRSCAVPKPREIEITASLASSKVASRWARSESSGASRAIYPERMCRQASTARREPCEDHAGGAGGIVNVISRSIAPKPKASQTTCRMMKCRRCRIVRGR